MNCLRIVAHTFQSSNMILASFVAAFVSCVVVLTTWRAWAVYRKRMALSSIPSYPTAFINGTLTRVRVNMYNMLEFKREMFSKFGSTVCFLPDMVLTNGAVITVDPGNVEYMLKTNVDNFVKVPSFK